ncbi:MAG: nucleotidyltransferase domain-containing protein [archaeon]|nr:nucleotidyltransferase domain-containing protein [archaeon]
MLTKEQLKIFGAFKKDIFAHLTFKQIKERSRQKSNNVVQIALKQFQEENLVKVQKTGDVTAYFLNMDNNLALSYLSLINELEINENKKVPKKVLKDIQKRVSRFSDFFVLMVFGSYAKNKATKRSDLDIALIVDSEQSKKEIAPYIETIKRREIIKIDYHVFTRNEFVEMLTVDEENVGKEIYRKNIIYYGLTEYYNMINGIQERAYRCTR